MAYWVWVTAGLILLILEIFLPLDFFLFFIGLAALATGAIVATGTLVSTELQLLVFALLSPVLLYLGRRPLSEYLRSETGELTGTLEGSKVMVTGPIAPGETGKGELRGTTWTVKNETDEFLMAGRKYTVSESGGTSLIVKSQGV